MLTFYLWMIEGTVHVVTVGVKIYNPRMVTFYLWMIEGTVCVVTVGVKLTIHEC